MTIIHNDTEFAPSAFADSVIDHRSAREHYEREVIKTDIANMQSMEANMHRVVNIGASIIVACVIGFVLAATAFYGLSGGFR